MCASGIMPSLLADQLDRRWLSVGSSVFFPVVPGKRVLSSVMTLLYLNLFARMSGKILNIKPTEVEQWYEIQYGDKDEASQEKE